MGIIKEFMEFLYEYKVIPLAIAFIMGVASTAVIKSLVDNIIMPLISPLLPGGDWRTAVFSIGPFKIGWGPFIGDVINFIIIAFVIFLAAKYLFKEAKVTKK